MSSASVAPSSDGEVSRINVFIDGKPATLVNDGKHLYLARPNATSATSQGSSTAFDPSTAFLALPHALVLHCSLVTDSDGGSLLLRFLSPPPGSKKVRAWLKHLKTRESVSAPAEELRQLLAGPFASLKLIKTEARVAADDVASAKAWVDKVFELAYTSPLTAAPIKPFKKLRVLINPVGGPGKAKVLYETRIRPILEAAGCRIDATFTTHRLHGLEIARDEENLPYSYDAVVCVSGDGMLHEVLNGLATRPKDAKTALDRLPVVPIPTGSGNATSVCLLGAEQGFNLAQACLNAIKGQPIGLDVCSVTQAADTSANGAQQVLASAPKLPYTRYFSFLSQAIGLMADVDIGTENMRALGDARFIIGYLGGVISNEEAKVIVDVKLGAKGTKNRAEMRARALEAHENAAKSQQKAIDDVEEAVVNGQVGVNGTSESAGEGLPALRHGSITEPIGEDSLPDFDIVDPSWSKSESFAKVKKGASPVAAGESPSLSSDSTGGWQRVRQPISTLYAGKIPYVARDLLQFPYAQPGDGTIDIALLLHAGGRMAKIRAIGSAETGAAIYDKAVSYLKVEAFRVTPVLPAGHKKLKQGGLISIDGEQVPYAPFQVEVTPGLQMKVLSLYGKFCVPEIQVPSTGRLENAQ